MGDPTTLTLNLTFLGTVGLGFIMFLVMFLMFIITLLIAGTGKLVAVIAMALVGKFPRHETTPIVHVSGPLPALREQVQARGGSGNETPVHEAPAPKAPRPAKDWGALLKPAAVKSSVRAAVEHHPLLKAAKPEPAVLADDWAAAVAAADARAAEREKARQLRIQTTVRDLPDPAVPAQDISQVAPLVESALQTHGAGPAAQIKRDPIPQSFQKPYIPAGLVKAGSGSPAPRNGIPTLKQQAPQEHRKAG